MASSDAIKRRVSDADDRTQFSRMFPVGRVIADSPNWRPAIVTLVPAVPSRTRAFDAMKTIVLFVLCLVCATLAGAQAHAVDDDEVLACLRRVN